MDHTPTILATGDIANKFVAVDGDSTAAVIHQTGTIHSAIPGDKLISHHHIGAADDDTTAIGCRTVIGDGTVVHGGVIQQNTANAARGVVVDDGVVAHRGRGIAQ